MADHRPDRGLSAAQLRRLVQALYRAFHPGSQLPPDLEAAVPAVEGVLRGAGLTHHPGTCQCCADPVGVGGVFEQAVSIPRVADVPPPQLAGVGPAARNAVGGMVWAVLLGTALWALGVTALWALVVSGALRIF